MKNDTIYICPMHPEVRQTFPGKCRKCGGMQLVPETDVQKTQPTMMNSQNFFITYRPLFLILGGILLVAIALSAWQASRGVYMWQDMMMNFMGVFFVVFSGLKLMDVPGFANGYAKYDLLASRVKAYGYVYPFLELSMGVAYLTQLAPWETNVVTLVLMIFSGIGVVQRLMQGKKVECACLGTKIKVPLTKVTVVEDFGMAAMAAVMLLF